VNECFICDGRTGDVLEVLRSDGTSYAVPMCRVCVSESVMGSRPVRLAHELIDARNAYRRDRSIVGVTI
jgi:hypothetical protein